MKIRVGEGSRTGLIQPRNLLSGQFPAQHTEILQELRLVSGSEYSQEISEHLLPGSSFHFDGPNAVPAQMFFYLYFLMTGLHALHITIGILLILVFAWRVRRSGHLSNDATSIELLGLYWHFVDIVWVFLFPLIYLVDRHS